MTEVSCWNSIGVWGKERPRCHLLEEVVNCRNCQVFVDAGRELLDRVVSAEEMDAAARRLAGSEASRGETEETQSFILFQIGTETVALASSVMRAVVRKKSWHTIPHRSNSILLGLIGIRGRLRLAIDLGAVLGIQDQCADPDPRTLVTSFRGQSFVFPVERVTGLEKLPIAQLEPGAAASCRRGVLTYQRKPVTLLHTERLWSAIREGAGL